MRRLTNVDEIPKILYAEGRALIMLSEFPHARKVLLQAQRLEPNNREIIISLQELEQRAFDARRYELEAAKRAMKFINEAEEVQAKEQKDVWEAVEERRQGMLIELKRFKESNEIRLNLPDHFSTDEMTIVEEIVKSLQLKLNTSEYGEKTYYLSKN